MSTPSASIRDWARRLLAMEAASQSASGVELYAAVQVSEKLRTSLTRFIGIEGFTALLRRALVLARIDVPSLQHVKVTADGRLEVLREHAPDAEANIDAATAITGHLLELLVVFVGESSRSV